MANDTILGIHSNVTGAAGYIDGHAWITVTISKHTRFYGLWPDEHPSAKKNGPGWDVREGMEMNSKPKASRYYLLSDEQVKTLNTLLVKNVTWGYTNNCSSWAHDIISDVVHEDVDADDYLWFSETPRELGRNILLLEMKSPTSLSKPKAIVNSTGTSKPNPLTGGGSLMGTPTKKP